MPAIQLTLPIPARQFDDVPAGPALHDATATIELLDEAGQRIGDPVEAAVPETRLVEGRGADGGLAWGPVSPRLSLTMDPSAEATRVRVTRAGQSTEVALSDVTEPDPRLPDARRTFPEGGGRWKLAVVSERFTDKDVFFDHVETLHRFISGQAPFSDPDMSFAIEALYWASDPVEGLFGASDRNLAGRVLDGENGRVVRFVRHANASPRKILVLINSTQRAGAGGQGRDIPSWSTVSAPPHEPWQAIALHELGHAFGLADEYETRYDLDEPNPLEPNVSAEKDPANTSWHRHATVAAPPAPTAGLRMAAGHQPTTIGTFQGARYRDDRYRPSPTCRMRTTTEAFCRICQLHIRKELLR